MHIQISMNEGGPIYQQIVDQIRRLVASGRLAPGEELPPIRVLAEQLVINPNTVARAYRELEVAGVVTKRRTSGTYVSGGAVPLDLNARLELLRERVEALLEEARQLDISPEELLDYARNRAERLWAEDAEEARR